MANQPVINSLNAGELSPYLHARNDLSKYNSGCLVMENFLPLTYGGVVARPNIKYVASTKADDKVRLISFEFSTSEAYILELGDEYVRFYKDGAQLKSGGSPYEIASPWDVDDVYDLKFVQSADVMWFVHPDYPVYKLSRFADTNWTLAEVEFDYPALLEENATNIHLKASATTGTGITITVFEDAWATSTAYVVGDYVIETNKLYICAVAHTSGTFATDLAAGKWTETTVFDANHVGSFWEIRHPRTNNVVTGLNNTGAGPVAPSGTTNTLSGRGTIGFTTTGTWDAADDIAIWKSEDGGTTWSKFRQYNMEGRNVDASWEESDGDALYAVTATAATAKIRLFVQEFYTKGLVKIKTYSSSTSVTADIINDIGSTDATTLWTEGAWSDYRGYPKACAIWESRLIFAGTLSNPNTLWLSHIDDFENFEIGTLDDDPMKITIGSGRIDDIVWMVPQRPLVIGTAGSEWVLEAESDNKPVTPTSFSLKRKTTYGSKDIQATLVNSAVMFLMRQGRKIREFVYRFDVDDYVAPDLTILSEHITEGGIVDSAYQQQPDNILHLIRADGTLVPMVYERDQEVTAFARWTLDGGNGTFDSVAVIARNANEDQVWVSCTLTVDGYTKRYIGYFDNREWGDDVATEWSGSDFYTVFDSPASTTLTGLDYLEGKTVDIVRDGFADPQQTVGGGEITLVKSGASRVVVGLPRTCTVAPIYIEPMAQFQQPMGKKKGVYKAILRFKDTLSAKVGQSLNNLETVVFRTTEDELDTQTALFSGEKKVNFENKYERLHTCYVVQDKPLPIQLIAMIPSVKVYE